MIKEQINVNIEALKASQADFERRGQIIEACLELQRRALSYLEESETWYAQAFPNIQNRCLHRVDIAMGATLRLLKLLEKERLSKGLRFIKQVDLN